MNLSVKSKLKLIKHNKPILKASNLKFRYPEQKEYILKDLSLKLYPQEVRIIVGPSGCGKSTLVNAICGFIPNSIEGELSGSIKIAGKDNANRTLYEIARDISLVQQDPEAQLCTMNVTSEIAFALENFMLPEHEIKARILWVLDKLRINHLRNRQLHTLSGGEKQKVAIASLLVMKPKVLVFDEPTANLDPKAALDFINIIDRLRFETKVGILIVDHNPAQYYRIADHLLVLNNGSIQHVLSSHQYNDFNNEYYKQIYNQKCIDYKSQIIGKSKRIKKSVKKRVKKIIRPLNGHIKFRVDHNKSKYLQKELIKLNKLSFNYTNLDVLKNISFSIKTGEFIGIMGDNGSGKTTLIHNILKLLPSKKGIILYNFNGSKISKSKEFSTSDLARNIGYVFQNPNHMIFANTVWDEVMLGPRNFGQNNSLARKKALELLKLGELINYRITHPVMLSHGEKRRLNLASILCYDPDVIMLDEPFIGQDPKNIAKILEYLIQIVSSGKTVIMVTHRSDIVAQYCSRVLFLKNGELVFDDRPDLVFQKLRGLGETSYLPYNFQSLGGKQYRTIKS